jgi:hypothetical protein
MGSKERRRGQEEVERSRPPGESEEEHRFWCRYWEMIRAKGVAAGREIWYERACAGFVRELKPRRLREAMPEDVTRFLGLLAIQPDAEGWKIRQADDALHLLLGEMVHVGWAKDWPVGLPELDGWMQGPEGGGKMPMPGNGAQKRFEGQVNKMVASLRCLHYSYRTEEAYVGWAQRFVSFANAAGGVKSPLDCDG